MASVLATSAYGQGQYYPVNPAGAPYGSTYTGITVHSSPNLQFLQNTLQTIYGPTVTLQVPIPTGSTAPTTAQYTNTVLTCAQAIVTGGAGVPAGVTVGSLAAEAVGWRPADLAATTTAVSQGIITSSATPAAAVANLNSVTDALAKVQPSLINSIVPSIFNAAGASTNTTIASSIPQLTATAVADVPTDLTRVNSIVNAGLAALSASTLTAAQKTTAFTDPSTGIVAALLAAPVATNNPALIDIEVKNLTFGGFSGMASLTAVLNASVAALQSKSNATNATMASLVDGALRSQGGNASTIASVVGGLNPGTQSYTDQVVAGYNNSSSLTAFQGYVTANPSFADAIASGATVRGALTSPVIVQWALVDGTAAPSSVVAAAVYANQSNAIATVLGAINTTARTPYGAATFADIAMGGATAAPVEQVGNVVANILNYTSTSNTTLNSTTVDSVVNAAIAGANSAGKTGAFADIVYKAEAVAYVTPGISGALVTQAVDSINTAGGSSYIAVIAALAGDLHGANRSAIQTAGFAEVGATSGDVTAAQSGASLVQAIQTGGATKTYTNTLSAFNTASTNASPTNSVIADLYAAVLANPNEADAGLAVAIKQSSVSDSLLVSVASDAYRTSHSTFLGLNPALQEVRKVVTHVKSEALAGNIGDLFDFVGHEIVTNTAMTQDIAVAATVIDPDHAHYIAGSVAFNNPLQASASVGSIFTYAQITNPHPLALPSLTNPSGALGTKAFPGSIGVVIDQPAAAAAITASLATGILEANLSTTDTKNALISTISAAVIASVVQNNTVLRGPVNPFNGAGDTAKTFQQSDGGVGTSRSEQTYGAAGAITGYIAEVTNNGDSTISAVTAAVLTAAVGGNARPYALEMAQAAGQALRWVGGTNVSSAAGGSMAAGNPIFDIASAINTTVAGLGGITLTNLENAVAFGITQAAAGVIGAGALGLNATNMNNSNGTVVVKAIGNNNSDFYIHRSATGAPVTDIFNL
ncbi:beta strand repeat-containing protein [Chthoniobacter flavus]|uniref:beta strand repeat-containing protein n=1 Tax=Chthoniobacter flavus TaxID=191863 RepID=UPI0005B2CECF|nr:hypothetical protein [Chthoniobacter flavus]